MTRCAPPYTFFIHTHTLAREEENEKKIVHTQTLNSISYFTGINFERNVQNKTAIFVWAIVTIVSRKRHREKERETWSRKNKSEAIDQTLLLLLLLLFVWISLFFSLFEVFFSLYNTVNIDRNVAGYCWRLCNAFCTRNAIQMHYIVCELCRAVVRAAYTKKNISIILVLLLLSPPPPLLLLLPYFNCYFIII